jgi:hypothetical protein
MWTFTSVYGVDIDMHAFLCACLYVWVCVCVHVRTFHVCEVRTNEDTFAYAQWVWSVQSFEDLDREKHGKIKMNFFSLVELKHSSSSALGHQNSRFWVLGWQDLYIWPPGLSHLCLRMRVATQHLWFSVLWSLTDYTIDFSPAYRYHNLGLFNLHNSVRQFQ